MLLRIILAIPHAIVLGLLGSLPASSCSIAAIMVLINETYPDGIFNFLRGYARWNARIYAYLAGFVQDYPPFALDTGSEAAASPASQATTSPTRAPESRRARYANLAREYAPGTFLAAHDTTRAQPVRNIYGAARLYRQG